MKPKMVPFDSTRRENLNVIIFSPSKEHSNLSYRSIGPLFVRRRRHVLVWPMRKAVYTVTSSARTDLLIDPVLDRLVSAEAQRLALRSLTIFSHSDFPVFRNTRFCHFHREFYCQSRCPRELVQPQPSGVTILHSEIRPRHFASFQIDSQNLWFSEQLNVKLAWSE